MNTTTIGLDLAKNVFQVHGIDAAGQITVRRKLRRSEMTAPVIGVGFETLLR